MNNEQFRRLLLANAAKSNDKNGTSPPSAHSTPSTSASAALGSRLKPSMPMTPRSVAGARVDFAKQLAERNQSQSSGNDKPQKKFRTSAPKGSRLAAGYVDRAKTREEEEHDERVERLQTLEEALKNDEMDRETYERLRNEIVGGDLSSTHLVKGLDFKLLERVRRGEDVFNENPKPPGESAAERERNESEPPHDQEDADAILEQLESTEVKAIERERVQKKGQFATTGTLQPGQKRTRNQILAELKAARAAAAAAKAKPESVLSSKFKKIGEKKEPGVRIERDGKGREVMIIVDEDGHERRKVRKLDPKEQQEEEEKERQLLASGKVLGMEVPEVYRKQMEAQQAQEEPKEISIFDDVGSDYDPLAGLESEESSDEEEGEAKEHETKEEAAKEPANKPSDMPPPPLPKPAAPAAKNYFKDSKAGLVSEEKYKAPSLNDPEFLAALRKAKAASALEKSEEEKKAAEREERLKRKLSELHRDDEDLDMGFGSSRLEDTADMEDAPVKLSAWDEDDEDGGGGGGGGGGDKSKRKRGKKKKGGDKNNFADIMKVIESRKGGHDDTFAILLAAYHPAIRILGISTVFGNASLEKTTRNAASILTAIAAADSIPLYVGASHALYRPPMHAPTDIHGDTGLDGTSLLPSPRVEPITSVPAIDAAHDALMACPPGTAWVVATGAFTNAAALFLKYPHLVGHVKGLSLMGGALGGGFTPAVLGKVDGVPRVGNWTQWAEFNVLADPEAAAAIFGNRELAKKTTLIPLDVSHLVLTTEEVRDLLLFGQQQQQQQSGEDGEKKEPTKLRRMLVELLMFFAKTYSDVFGITDGPPLHDPLAVAAVLAGLDDDTHPITTVHPHLKHHAIPFIDAPPYSHMPTPPPEAGSTTPSPPPGATSSSTKERFQVTVETRGTYEEARAGLTRTGQITAKLLPPGEEGVRIPRSLDIPRFWRVLEECVARADAAVAAAGGEGKIWRGDDDDDVGAAVAAAAEASGMGGLPN
ncbi:hypothetical protein VTJ49DRAFT_7235 [Mycothermus thermophilus]|uniref:Inosine/uridine-preferring nucleoside hydrolase domain-containing protein n=1 Tax=Humicola insolens TaxID=85995 RepID=A0ABR3VHE6_HUMIN